MKSTSTQFSPKNPKKRPLDDTQKALIAQLKDLTTSDYHRLYSRIYGLSNVKNPETKQAIQTEIEQDILTAQAHFSSRKAHQESLNINYPDLPVSARRE